MRRRTSLRIQTSPSDGVAMSQTCSQCGEDRTLDDFYKSSKGVPMAACKDCHKRRVQVNRRERLAQYTAYERSRANLPKRVEARREYAKTDQGKAAFARARTSYKSRYPLKRAAHVAVGNAIRDGRLVRSVCEVCGAGSARAHHDDYGRPLDVRWLCGPHHAEWHRHNTPIYPDKEQAA